MFLNPIKSSDENDVTFLNNNDKPGMLETVAKCLECFEEWNIFSKGGPNVCHKCGSSWWENGRRTIIFKQRERSL